LSLKREAALGAAPAIQVTDQGKPVMEQLAARWVVAFSMVLIGAFSLIRFLPSPTTLPDYVRFLPADSSLGQSVEREPEATASPGQATPELATPTLAATGATATITVESVNCRSKPRPGAERVTFLYKDQQVEIVGRNDTPANPWWYVKIPDSNDHCWLWGNTAKMTGTVEEIPIVR
jgi:hypothetical protein